MHGLNLNYILTMKLSELKAKAQAILDIKETDGIFSIHEFRLKSGGAPRNKIGVKEEFRSENFEYNTTANGAAYSGSIGIMCKDSGVRDKRELTIFITPNNTSFVYIFVGSSAERFDWGALAEPEL